MIPLQYRISLMFGVFVAVTPIIMICGMGSIQDEQNNNLDINLSEISDINPSEIKMTNSVKEDIESTAAVTNGIHDLFLGQVGYNDRKLLDVYLHAPGRILRIVKKILHYPHYLSSSRYNITAIYVQDLSRNGTGGYPIIERGGIGQKFAHLSIKSQRSQGLDYHIRIWGR